MADSPLDNHRYDSSPSLNEVVNNHHVQHQGQYSELQETLYDFNDRKDDHVENYQYYDYQQEEGEEPLIAQKPTEERDDEYNNQQVDRLDVDYEYYEDDGDTNDKDYDYVYYYYLDYIDSNANQIPEKLPRPSYQKEKVQ